MKIILRTIVLHLKIRRNAQTNFTYFFDTEIEFIALHYIDFWKNKSCKKAIKIGNRQHPSNINILLLKSEILILEDKYQSAEKILSFVHKIEPNNQDAYIQKANILSKLKNMKNQSKFFVNVSQSEYKFEIWQMTMEFLTICEFKKALVYFKLCIKNEPNDHQILYNLIYCIDNVGCIKKVSKF